MPNTNTTHVVFGTGPLGRSVMRALVAQGKPVRMVNRSGRADVPSGVEVVASDLYNPDNVRAVTRDAAVVYQTSQPGYTEWVAKFPPLISSILDGLRGSPARLVLGDNLYMIDNTHGAPIMENAANNAVTRKGRVRALCADMAFTAHKAGFVKVAAVRASDFYGPYVLDSALGERTFPPLLAGKSVGVIGSADILHTHTFISDFGKAIALVGERDSAMGRAWHVPTTGPITTRAFLEQAAQIAGVPLKLSKITPLMLRALGLFVGTVREVIEMQYQFNQPYIVDASDFIREFGDISTPRETALKATLDWFTNHK